MKYDVSPELAAVPARLAALISGEPDPEIDAMMDEAEHEDGIWDGVPPAIRDEQRYFYRIETLANAILRLVDRDSGAESIMPYLSAWAAKSRGEQPQEQPLPEMA